MERSKRQIVRHFITWVILWLTQSILFGAGKHLEFYLVKNLAIVLMQAAIVYLNWFILKHVDWQRSSIVLLYSFISILTIYLIFSLSFEIISLFFSVFLPDIIRLPNGQNSWWPTGFWTILSGSAPYSIALLTSTIIYLISYKKQVNTGAEKNGSIEENDFLMIKDGKTIHRLRKAEILYVEGLKEYVNWYTHDQKIITLHSLHKIEEELKGDGFLRTHKSYIVNTSSVSTIKHNLLEVSGNKIPIGRSYREKVAAFFHSEME